MESPVQCPGTPYAPLRAESAGRAKRRLEHEGREDSRNTRSAKNAKGGAAMAFVSVTVVSNATRLRAFKPRFSAR